VTVSESDANSYALNVTGGDYDLAISPQDTSETITAKKVTASVAQYKKGAKIGTLTGAAIKIKNPDGTQVAEKTAGTGTTASLNLYSDNYDDIISGQHVYYKANGVKAGTYSVSAEVESLKLSWNSTFTLKDTQTKAVASIKDVEYTYSATSDAYVDAKTVLKGLATTAVGSDYAFSYSYNGVRQTEVILPTLDKTNSSAKENGKALYVTSVSVVVKNSTASSGVYILTTADINTSFTLN
jgi:hypothetical protein